MKPSSFDHKSKMRIIEHGEEWTEVTNSIIKPGWLLLQSVKTGYLKWWNANFIEGC